MSIVGTTYNAGEGLKFDGVNDYVNLGRTSLLGNLSECSISIIYRNYNQPGVNAGLYMEDGTPNGISFGVLLLTNNKPYLYFENILGNGYEITALNALNYYVRYNIVVTFKAGSFAKMYVNNVFQNQVAVANSNVSNRTRSRNISIGSQFISPNTYINGIIEDIKVFNKELTQSEVTSLYQKQGQIIPSSAIASCVLDMRFNDKSGTIAKDSSVSGYNGTLTNFANTSLGASNAWVDQYGNAITQY